MSKFLYPIYKLKTKSYIKWWLYHKKADGSGILSEILQGFSFNLENTLNRKFNLFEIQGNSVQDGSPSPDNEVPIYSAGDNGTINEKISNKNLWSSVWEQGYINANGVNENNSDLIRTKDYIYFEPEQHYAIKRSIFNSYTNVRGYDINKNFIGTGENVINLYQGNTANNPMQPTIQTCVIATKPGVYYLRFNDASNNLSTEYMMVKGDTPEDYVPHEEQDYSIFVQQPMRSIGDVRDCFVKKSDGWYERHLPYIASYNGETLPQDVYNEVDNVKYCNEKSMSTTGQFSIGASVQYIDENNWNDLPCTPEQIQQLENKPSTYKDFTIIQSEDETPAHLKIQYYKEG